MAESFVNKDGWEIGDEVCLLDRFNDTRFIVVEIKDGFWHTLRRVSDGERRTGYIGGELRRPPREGRRK